MNRRFGFVKVATASFDTMVADPDANAKSMASLMRQARSEQVDILVFPELALTGYTCADLFLQSFFIRKAEHALYALAEESRGSAMIIVAGLPVLQDGRLFNAAVFLQDGRLLGAVPKSYVPNYQEFYEARWFVPALARLSSHIRLCGQEIPFAPEIIVRTGSVRLACEICEDLWTNLPPSSFHTFYGANIIVNPSASNEVATKSRYRRDLVRMQSGRCSCAYVYASSGAGESTTDLVFSGHCIIADNGMVAAESQESLGLLCAILDLERLENERLKVNSAAQASGGVRSPFDYIYVDAAPMEENGLLPLQVDPFPFVPPKEESEARCLEILHLQARGLAQRLRRSGLSSSVIGISGGLDSTLALLVSVEAHRLLGWPVNRVLGVTMPGFGTSAQTKGNALDLMKLLGVTCRTVDIRPACERHFQDIGHAPDHYDVTFENVQARERTQILMDIANQEHGLVIGTGDLSELALGWSTYNGDHMSMYAVNCGVPKTLVRFLVSVYGRLHPELQKVLEDICHTAISPELLPPDSGGHIQSTEDAIGRYALHDFFLYHFVRHGCSREKIQTLAFLAFPEIPQESVRSTLDVFMRRFATQQFKRSCLPDGPKVGTVALSPRGDWRMPSDLFCPSFGSGTDES